MVSLYRRNIGSKMARNVIKWAFVGIIIDLNGGKVVFFDSILGISLLCFYVSHYSPSHLVLLLPLLSTSNSSPQSTHIIFFIPTDLISPRHSEHLPLIILLSYLWKDPRSTLSCIHIVNTIQT
jgi:hypothetical protein